MASKHASFHDGVLARVLFAPVKLVFASVLALIAVLVLAWTIDLLFVFKVWPEGVARLKGVLAADLEREIELAAIQGHAPEAGVGTANFLYGVVFRTTGIHDMARDFAQAGELSIPDTIVRNFYVANQDAIEVAMVATKLLGVRLSTIVRMLPLFVLIYAVAAADGLTHRAIRRACGGRESASLYHRAKHTQVAVGGTAVMAILAWPDSVKWLPAALTLTLALGILARIQWTYYKKYL